MSTKTWLELRVEARQLVLNALVHDYADTLVSDHDARLRVAAVGFPGFDTYTAPELVKAARDAGLDDRGDEERDRKMVEAFDLLDSRHPGLDEECRKLLREGKLIAAIQFYKDHANVSLKEAYNHVHALTP
jgi:hypothetical protein